MILDPSGVLASLRSRKHNSTPSVGTCSSFTGFGLLSMQEGQWKRSVTTEATRGRRHTPGSGSRVSGLLRLGHCLATKAEVASSSVSDAYIKRRALSLAAENHLRQMTPVSNQSAAELQPRFSLGGPKGCVGLSAPTREWRVSSRGSGVLSAWR